MRPAYEDPPEARGVPFAAPGLTPVVRALLIANAAVFVLQWVLLEGWFPRAFDFVRAAFALNPLQWLGAFPWLPAWQLVSYGFLHASPTHVLFNMLFLYFLGTMLEAEVGGRRFLVFYLVSVALAGACQLVLGLALGQAAPIVGASGGVLAVVFAMATLRPNMRVIFILVPLTLRTVALIHLGLDLFGALSQLKGHASDAASFAHLTGALVGFLAVRRGWIWLDPAAALAGWRARRGEEREASDAARLDALLSKINREGIHALSARERAFMTRVSRRRRG
jgi:membrane associated rhomboid family serine protease